jgi:hypothetical protein
MINLYWNVGAYIKKQLASAGWGEKTVDELADFIQKNHPDLKGFNRRGLYRMKQFYETYSSMSFVSSLMTQIQISDFKESGIVSSTMTQLETSDIKQSILAQISWTHHLTLLSRTKTDEEREYYLRLCIKENYSVKELEMQINSGVYERVMIGNSKLSPMLRDIHPDITSRFKDSYVFEFLNLTEPHNENELQ